MNATETKPKYLQNTVGKYQAECLNDGCGWVAYGDRRPEIERAGDWHRGRCRRRRP